MTIRYKHPAVEATLAGKLATLAELLARPVDVSSLAMFRLLFGALMVWEVGRYFSYGYITRYYIEPQFHFTYEFFPFVAPLPGQGMYWLFLAMGLFALGLALGFCYKLSTLLFLLTYTYVFLLDKTPYNNHYYLIILLSFLLLLVDAQRWASLERAAKPGPETVPLWQLLILRAQILIVYFYGGIAKLNSDWLRGEPMRLWLAERTDYPLLGPFFATEWAVYLFSYGGLFFDLGIGFLLLWRPARFLAFLGLLFFHLMNNWLFSIGIFPFLALASTILFVEPGWPRQVLRSLGRPVSIFWSRVANRPSPQAMKLESRACSDTSRKIDRGQLPMTSPQPARLNAWTFGFILFYLALQLLIPLRHWLYPGNVGWTEEGHRFAWHMKLRDKEPRLEIKIIDPQTGQSWNADLKEDLTGDQIRRMAIQPDMILQYAHYLQEKLRRTGPDNSIIIANAWASLNGRPFQQLIDPQVNLAQVDPIPLAHAPWIVPLKEKLSHPSEPVLYSLAVITMLLANMGLALSIYGAVSYSGQVKTEFAIQVHRFDEGSAAVQTLTLAPGQFSDLIKVVSGTLPYLAILLSLAAWVITSQPIYLSVALAAALLAAGWGLRLAPLLSWRFDRSYLRWGPALLGILTSLLLLMQIIIVVQI